jgi:uncharacterized protein (TIGR02266 family)
MVDPLDMQKHQRSAFRLPIELLVQLKGEAKTLEEFCSNLSTSGIFIETRNILPVESSIEVTFSLPHNNQSFSAIGRVMWTTCEASDSKKSGMGIRFENLSNAAKDSLGSALMYYKSMV